MSKIIFKTIQECEDFVRGCTVFGTGGGGDPQRGVKWLSDTLERDGEVFLIEVEDIPDDAWTACMFGMGSIAPKNEETFREIERMGLKEADTDMSLSIQAFMDYTGIKLAGVIPMELGGSNSVAPVAFGPKVGVPCIDGDYAGRAVPEIAQTIPFMTGKTFVPYSGVDIWGDVCIVKEAAGSGMVERIGKMLSVAAYGGCMMTGILLKGKEMKKMILPGTLSKSYRVGKKIREARESGKDPVQAIIDFTNGWLLFQGEIEKKEWEDRGGYMYGTNYLNGIGSFKGHKMAVWFKNENHIVWRDEEPFVTSPDFVQMVDLQTGEPMTNTVIKPGDRVAVLGMKCADIYRTKKGLELLGPKHFGFQMDYIPIEECF